MKTIKNINVKEKDQKTERKKVMEETLNNLKKLRDILESKPIKKIA